ncbi:MAG: tetratricopeptide repeat protein, partial [Methanobacteriaceae archaeon]
YIYAKEILSDLISSNKDFADAWYLLGAILYEQGDPDSASFLMKAVSIEKGHIKAKELLKSLRSSEDF